jgi:hypothetical protein
LTGTVGCESVNRCPAVFVSAVVLCLCLISQGLSAIKLMFFINP